MVSEANAHGPEGTSPDPSDDSGGPPFLRRWPAPTHSPWLGAVLRQLLRRALLPGLLVLLAIVGLGLLIVGPLGELQAEEPWSAGIEARRDTLRNRLTDIWSTSTDTWFTIGTGVVASLLVLWLTRRWWVSSTAPIGQITQQKTSRVALDAIGMLAPET